MPSARASFEIRYRADHGTLSVCSRSDDADAATVAFHAALAQLRSERREGDLLLVKQDLGDRVLLRQPLDSSDLDGAYGTFPKQQAAMPGWVDAEK